MKTIPIYGGRLVTTKNQAEFNRAYIRELGRGGFQNSVEDVVLCSGGMTASEVVDNELVIVSGVFERKGSTRCHEAVHCAQAVAEAVGIDPIAEAEAFAYLTQWFYEELAP